LNRDPQFPQKKLTEIIDGIYPNLISLRRSLHQEPEIGFQEFQTTEKIIHFLNSLGRIEISRPLPTGLVANLRFGDHLPWIAIRADIDALELNDLKQVSYRSQLPGICHACGHDVHTTVLCGIAAVLLKEEWQIPVNIRLIFQPAEEPIPSGAPLMIEKGILDKIQTIWSLHVEPLLPLGTLGLSSGWVNAQSNKLEWELVGKSAHSARPQLGHNPILAGQRIIQLLQDASGRQWNTPDFPVVLVFTQFRTENIAYNIIPEKAYLGATLRITNFEDWEKYFSDISRINSRCEAETGVKVRFTVNRGSPPVYNDSKIIQRFRQNLILSESMDIVLEDDYRSMGGDDFGWYSQHIPAAMVRFGTSQGEITPAIHTGMFDVPESIIPTAMLFFLNQIFLWSD
jgi:amidohydrolase